MVPVPIIRSPVVVIGDKALNAADAVVCPVPPFAIVIVAPAHVVPLLIEPPVIAALLIVPPVIAVLPIEPPVIAVPLIDPPVT